VSEVGGGPRGRDHLVTHRAGWGHQQPPPAHQRSPTERHDPGSGYQPPPAGFPASPPGDQLPPTRLLPPAPPPRRRNPLGGLGTLLLIVLLVAVAVQVGKSVRGSDPLSPFTDPAGGSAATVEEAPSSARSSLSRAELVALGEKVTPGVVDVYSELGYQNARGAGTGIVLTPDGEVLTNNHVINGATAIRVTDLGNGRTYRADVVGYDRTKDVAVLRLHGASGLPTAVLGDSSRLAVGDPVAAVGNAGGVGGAPTVSGGTVTALNRSVSPTDELTGSVERLTGLIQVAANVQPGDSGGPLVDREGRVIGVDTAASANYRYQSSGGIGFAIPINSAIAVVRQIDAGQASETVHVGPTGMLGVSVLGAPVRRLAPDSPDEDRPFPGSGVAVAGVRPGSPAEQGGLGRGDMIVALDGITVDSPTTLTNLLVRHHPGDQVTLQWVDSSGQQRTATVGLVPGPPA
jgi:S1-C subfamily serine protease